ncbi:response regulator transcription factor [Patescibacteria group bacterium]|nr:response regulator transcription factor [Patescibacteria group bacterium]
MKILIIDDEKEIVEFIKRGLEKELFLVESAEDGFRGSFLARTGNYDLIILDYLLPKMNGAEVLKEIRADGNKVPVLMLTVKSEIQSKKKLFETGADDYLSKPFLLEELLLRVKALLKRPPLKFEEVIIIDDLVLDKGNKTVKRADEELYLTKKEYGLLEYLIDNRGKIISRSELLEHVWDYNADPFSNSVETHIASLRRKLNKNKNRDLVHTFSGRGYKFAVNRLG